MEHKYFIINRFDGYYDSINNKGNVFLGINVFAIGGLFASLISCHNYLNDCKWSYLWLSLMIILNMSSLLFTLRALIPYKKSYNKSLIFFDSISELTLPEFKIAVETQNAMALKEDLNDQIYSLAKGLSAKFSCLSTAGKLLFVEAVAIVPLLIAVTNNLK